MHILTAEKKTLYSRIDKYYVSGYLRRLLHLNKGNFEINEFPDYFSGCCYYIEDVLISFLFKRLMIITELGIFNLQYGQTW